MAGNNGHKPTLREQLAQVVPREETVAIPGLPEFRLRVFSRGERRAYDKEILGLPEDHEVRRDALITAYVARHLVDTDGSRPYGNAVLECLELEALDNPIIDHLYARVVALETWVDGAVNAAKEELEASPPS